MTPLAQAGDCYVIPSQLKLAQTMHVDKRHCYARVLAVSTCGMALLQNVGTGRLWRRRAWKVARDWKQVGRL